MKQIYILLVAMCAMCFTGCSKDDDDNDDDNREGVITMVKKEGKKVYSFGFCSFKEGEMITIDWGDGQVEEVITSETYDEGKVYYFWEGKHPYSDNKPHTITIKGNIKGLYCDGHGSNENYLTTLDVSRCKTLIELYCCQSNLTTLDVSRNTALTYLNCNSNAITTLDVSKNTTLTYLDCSENELTKLDVSNNIALTKLDCSCNNLSTLDVSKNTTLTYLSCDANNLSTLDVSKNTALTWLSCGTNNLTTLDVSKNTALTQLSCGTNNLSASALNQIFNDLPQVSDRYIFISNNPGSQTCNKSIAENKGWRVAPF